MRTSFRSRDRGTTWTAKADASHTWSKPRLCFIGGMPRAVSLPDGGIVVGSDGGRLDFSYDAGRTWARVDPAQGQMPILNHDTLIVANATNWDKLTVWRPISTARPDPRGSRANP